MLGSRSGSPKSVDTVLAHRPGVNPQEVVCRFEPVHRRNAPDTAVRSMQVVIGLPARQSVGSLG